MRLLFLVSSLPVTKIGGAEIMTLRICEQLSIQGSHEPFIYTIPQSEAERQRGTLESMLDRYGITGFPVENIRFSRVVNDDRLLSYTRAKAAYSLGIGSVLDEIRPDLLITMRIQPPDLLCNSIALPLRSRCVPLVVMIRGVSDVLNPPDLPWYNRRKGTMDRLTDLLYYQCALPPYLKRASMVISQTSAQSHILRRTFGIRSPALFNPIDGKRIQHILHQTMGERKGNGPEGIPDHSLSSCPRPVRLIYVGSLTPKKNLPLLLGAMHILNRDWRERALDHRPPPYALTIVGGGRGEETLRRSLAGFSLDTHHEVHLTGPLPHDRIWPLLSRHDIFVFPPCFEGFPNVLLEAMACGLPIVSSDFLGVRDIIRSGENGVICDPADPRDMAEKIAELARNPSCRAMGEHNRNYVKQFSWEHYMVRLEGLLKEAIRRGKRNCGGASRGVPEDGTGASEEAHTEAGRVCHGQETEGKG